jgi:hypothetical protein|tara:strand:- start:1145 stop:1447 length:303 start_codon:yes stop_codon:yes gene_type:complete
LWNYVFIASKNNIRNFWWFALRNILLGGIMNINKWKSCAVDIESYTIIRAMGQNGFRRPGNMIAKLVDDEVKKIAKKQNISYDKMKQNLLAEGNKLLKGK